MDVGWTLGGRWVDVRWTLSGRWVDVGWTLGGRWVDAQPTFEDAVKIWSRGGHAFVTRR